MKIGIFKQTLYKDAMSPLPEYSIGKDIMSGQEQFFHTKL